jgi:3-methyladenine DNA glycosylase AlkC
VSGLVRAPPARQVGVGMAASLESFFDAAVVERIGAMVAAVHPPFRRRAFAAAATAGLSRLELVARGRHVADALARALPADFEEAARILVASLGPELPAEGSEREGMDPFLYLPHAILVGERGLDHFEAAMAAQHAITRRFTAEWSIRPFLERHFRRSRSRSRRGSARGSRAPSPSASCPRAATTRACTGWSSS